MCAFICTCICPYGRTVCTCAFGLGGCIHQYEYVPCIYMRKYAIRDPDSPISAKPAMRNCCSQTTGPRTEGPSRRARSLARGLRRARRHSAACATTLGCPRWASGEAGRPLRVGGEHRRATDSLSSSPGHVSLECGDARRCPSAHELLRPARKLRREVAEVLLEARRFEQEQRSYCRSTSPYFTRAISVPLLCAPDLERRCSYRDLLSVLLMACNTIASSGQQSSTASPFTPEAHAEIALGGFTDLS